MTKIHLQIFGAGKSIVLVHGWAMHTGIWREFAQQLAQHCRVICIDLPGHGYSEKTDPFTLEQISATIVNAIPPSFTKEGGICWLGWSLGAIVVLDIANRYPERVSSLVLLAGNPLFTQTAQWPGMDVQLLDDFAAHVDKNCQAALLRFLSLQASGLSDYRTLLRRLVVAMPECNAPDNNTLLDGLKILKLADLRPVLSRLNIPIAAILGGLDTLVPVTVGKKMQQLLPHMELNIISRAGHLPFLSHSQETVAIISQFINERCI